MTKIFAGQTLADQILKATAKRVRNLSRPPTLATIYFAQDPGSVLYTRKKIAAGQAVGVEFRAQRLSFTTPFNQVQAYLQSLAGDRTVTGLMVQKPRRVCYQDFFTQTGCAPPLSYDHWWQAMVTAIPLIKDVDGLSPETQAQIAVGQARILPATVSAVIKAVSKARSQLTGSRILIIGRTDLLGLPLTAFWRNQGLTVTLAGRAQLTQLVNQPGQLQDFDLIVSAIGQPNLISASMVKRGVILIDVGEPEADFDFNSLQAKASFITPVPGGIGPLTIACLLENLTILAELNR